MADELLAEVSDTNRRTFRLKSPELKAMDEIDGILSELEDAYGKPAARRAINWLVQKWSMEVQQ